MLYPEYDHFKYKIMKTIYFYLSMIILLASCKNSSQPQDPVPVHETFTIESEQVGETRTINVWTPPNYSTGTDSLPVLYMLDGGIQEDFPHIANTVSELIASEKIPPIILVGIENTQRRRDLTGTTEVEKDKEIAPVVGGSREFRTFIQEELFSEVNKRYRTTSEKGIIGESLAGLFVVETLLLGSDMFDYYIAFDPSLWWNDGYLNKTAKEHLIKISSGQKKFWFAGSQAKDISGATNSLAKSFKESAPANLKWTYSDEPNEKHSTIFRATKEKALIWTWSTN